MAKSFKQPAGSSAPSSSPLVSAGPDFFDMVAGTGQPAVEPPGQLVAAATPEVGSPADLLPVANLPSEPKLISPRRKARPTGNTRLSVLPPLPLVRPRELPPPGPDTRQTFVVGTYRLEQFRDYVHARRSAGDYHFSQKQALDEAIAEYLANREPAPPRPEEAHAWEQQFRERIQQGRQTGKTPAAD